MFAVWDYYLLGPECRGLLLDAIHWHWQKLGYPEAMCSDFLKDFIYLLVLDRGREKERE